MKRPLALVMLSGGGFSFETTRLLEQIGEQFDFTYLATRFGGEPGDQGIPAGKRHEVPQFSSKTKASVWISANAFIKTFLAAVRLLRREPVDLVIVVGCSHAVPIMMASKILGKRSVYIESITRADRLSNTGKIVYYMKLATKFLIQWPDLQKKYPASALGSVL